VNVATEPVIKIGLITGAPAVSFALSAPAVASTGEPLPQGDYTVNLEGSSVALSGPVSTRGPGLSVSPVDFESSPATLNGVVIGKDFHWQRKESQSLQGTLAFKPGKAGITVINELPLESYLTSVISSEMSAACPSELLRAHAIVSRSWLLAQLLNEKSEKEERGRGDHPAVDESEIIRWYGRESHSDFDVCADDHCQRYQGISKAFSEAAFESVQGTRGTVLTWGDEICDARYSKSCGGMTEAYRAAWEDVDVPYLTPVYDGSHAPDGFPMPLSDHANAEAWITSSPPAYCDSNSPELLCRILPGFDQETKDFFRWEVSYSPGELGEILLARTGIDFGRVIALEPVTRGESGRITRLRIKGEKKTLTIGKELEIRRALSRSHLYSSAFVVTAEEAGEHGSSTVFRLRGAGWGHGVGLCQIGAAVMADRGHSHREILEHYFRGSELHTLY
jgi:peptidoglycan hydrolase-like amidase